MSQDSKHNLYLALGIGVALGIVFGAAFGLLFNNLALGIGPGIAFGASLGYAYSLWKKDESGAADTEVDPVLGDVDK